MDQRETNQEKQENGKKVNWMNDPIFISKTIVEIEEDFRGNWWLELMTYLKY